MEDFDDDLYSEIESSLHGIASEEKDRIASLLVSLFERLPEEDAFVLRMNRKVHFIMPLGCVAEPLYLSCTQDGVGSAWLICLRTDLATAPEYEFLYTVAHELAHAFLEHGAPGKPGDRPLKEIEVEADAQVIRWGFEEELRQYPHNYIYGDGLRNWNLA